MGECASERASEQGVYRPCRPHRVVARSLLPPANWDLLTLLQYFYHKTRNYRILWGGMREGSRYSLRLSSAVALFVAADEGFAYAREHLNPNSMKTGYPPSHERWGWRQGPVHVEDGAVAGATLATVLGLWCECKRKRCGGREVGQQS